MRRIQLSLRTWIILCLLPPVLSILSLIADGSFCYMPIDPAPCIFRPIGGLALVMSIITVPVAIILIIAGVVRRYCR
jgi:hypothetical protein